MKRFTETTKWSDVWFRNLHPNLKLAWVYICDNCDNSGVWDPDFALADFQIGVNVDWEKATLEFSDRVKHLENGKWHLVGFISFQQKELSPHKASHKQIISLCHKHGIGIPMVSHKDGMPMPTGNSNSHSKGLVRGGGGGVKKMTDDEFIASLKANSAYHGIDVQSQLSKMDAWLLVNPGRQKTRKFIVAWLNRCESPVSKQAQSSMKKLFTAEDHLAAIQNGGHKNE